MAKTAMKIKQQRTPKFSSREYTRCKICGPSPFGSEKIRNLQNLLP